MRGYREERERAAELADRFAGLPDGHSHWRLCDDLNAAREPLGLDSDALWLLIFYIKRTKELDWSKGNEPIVAWPKFEICALTGWSDDKVTRIEDRLCRAGLIAFRDAANCKRRAYRNQSGTLRDDASGISLAPAGYRAAEIAALGHSKAEEIRKLHKGYGELFALRAEVVRFVSADAVPEDVRANVEAFIAELPRRRDPHVASSAIRALLDRAKSVLSDLRRLLGLAPRAQIEETEPKEPDSDLAGCRDHRRQEDVAPTHVAPPHYPKRMHRKDAEQKDPDKNLHRDNQNLLDLLAASPIEFQAYVADRQRRGGSSWLDVLAEATERYAADLAVSRSVVGKLKRDYGLTKMLQTLFRLGSMAEKGAEIRNPCAYAMTIAKTGGGGRPMSRMH